MPKPNRRETKKRIGPGEKTMKSLPGVTKIRHMSAGERKQVERLAESLESGRVKFEKLSPELQDFATDHGLGPQKGIEHPGRPNDRSRNKKR